MPLEDHQLGDTYGSIVSWRWDRAKMRFYADTGEHEILIHFHKVGGRWSKTLPDGTPTHGARSSYWTYQIDGEHSPTLRFKSANEAKTAACVEHRTRFGKVDR